VHRLLPSGNLDEATTQWLWEMAMRPPAYVLMQTLAAMGVLDARDDLTKLTVPVTVLQGTADRFTPPSLGRALAAAVSGAEYLPFEGAGHLLGLEVRESFEETLLGLLARDAEEDHQKLFDSFAPAEEMAAVDESSPDEDAAGEPADDTAGEPVEAEPSAVQTADADGADAPSEGDR
jgi:hypothetical protein